MLKSIYEASLLDILPENLLEDNQIQALTKALDIELQSLSKDISQVLLLPRLDELPDNVLDLLAWQWHVDFYEPIGLDAETKRNLIRESIAWHKVKGTRWAVETMLRQFFGNGETPEWFEYGGRPYFFKILHDITDQEREYDRATIEYMKKVAFSVKNVRSWLDLIVFILRFEEAIKLPDEDHLFELYTHYAETIPYGQNGSSRYGYIKYGKFTYSSSRNLDLDEVHLQMALDAADRYETLVRYGRIRYGQFTYGGKMALPLEDTPVINLNLLNAEEVGTAAEKVKLATQVNIEDTYKHTLVYGRFKYGDNAAYGSQRIRPLEAAPKIRISSEIEEEVEIEESYGLVVRRPSHYGRKKYGKFQYGGEILCKEAM